MGGEIDIRNIAVIVACILALTGIFPSGTFAADTADEAVKNFSIADIEETWQSVPDDELNDYIGQSTDAELYDFLCGLSRMEQRQLTSRNTMLNNTVTVDGGDGNFREMTYYDWLMENGGHFTALQTRGSSDGPRFTAKSGHCFFLFVDRDNDYSVQYKVSFVLDSVLDAESEKNNYTVSSVIYKTTGEKPEKSGLASVTFSKQMTYMQKGVTSYKVLGDGTTDKNSSGETIYRTATTPIFVLALNVKKPAFTYGGWHISGFEHEGEMQDVDPGSRFTFREYNWQHTGETTFDSKVYHRPVTDNLTACINVLNCGFEAKSENPTIVVNSVPDNDILRVTYTRAKLKVRFDSNGGTVTPTRNNPDGTEPVERTIKYNDFYSFTYGLPHPSDYGFRKSGESPVSGREWISADGGRTWNQSENTYKATDILDFTDGTYFTEKIRIMKANWQDVSEPAAGSGKLIIRKEMDAGDYYASHGDAVFLFRIEAVNDEDAVYYRTVSFRGDDIGPDSVDKLTGETEITLPYGEYRIRELGVMRYENNLDRILPGEMTGPVRGTFTLDEGCEEVTAEFSAVKRNHGRFSHNDLEVTAGKQ